VRETMRRALDLKVSMYFDVLELLDVTERARAFYSPTKESNNCYFRNPRLVRKEIRLG
jgi:hypothetical protein